MTQAATENLKTAPQSRLGKLPIMLPKGVTATVSDGRCDVKGPKGTLSLKLPESVVVTMEGDQLRVASTAAPADAARLQGLGRALLANTVTGCAEGYQRTLELVGVGYRAELKGQDLHLSLGLSHTVVYPLPKGVSVDIPKDSKGAIIHLASADKALLGQAAAVIRSYRPPEPYGGKGVRYKGEQIRRKAGKAGKK
jgi:large subunit ribosomal protein L6